MPNPVRIEARLAFDLPQRADVRLAVYDAAGRLVRNLVQSRMPPGRHVVAWDRRDERGRRVGSGSCFVRLRTEAGSSTRRLVLAN
jgi:flagellar hook assembly protein FlgD